MSAALKKIQDSPSQEKTPENVFVINYILKHARAETDKREISAVAGYAVLWKDADIWKRVVEKVNQSRKSSYHVGPFELLGKENIAKACSTFDFNDIQTTYVISSHQYISLTTSHSIRLTTILDTGVTFQNQADLIKLLQTGSSEENVTKWCSERMTMILTSLQKMKLSKDDAPALLSIIADRGLAVLTDVFVYFVRIFSCRRLTTFISILPQLSPQPGGDPYFDLRMALIQGLYDQKARIAGDSGEATQLSQKRDKNSYEHAIDLCFTAAMQQWQSIESPTSSVMISQMAQLLEICITNRDLDACNAIFRVIVTSEEKSPHSQFENVYRPLVPQLRRLLAKQSTLDLSCHPFKNLMRFLIEQCLHNIGLKPVATSEMRRIGCGCHICGALDAFMLSNSTTRQFPGPRHQGQHLEQQISRASEIVASSRSRPNGNKGKAFTLVVTKKTETPAFAQWKVRQKEAESFLSSIGDSDMIAKIMGPRVGDVQMALTGAAVFAVDPSVVGMFRGPQSTTTATTTTIAAKSTPIPAAGSSTNSRGTPMLGVQTVGSKRKRGGEL